MVWKKEGRKHAANQLIVVILTPAQASVSTENSQTQAIHSETLRILDPPHPMGPTTSTFSPQHTTRATSRPITSGSAELPSIRIWSLQLTGLSCKALLNNLQMNSTPIMQARPKSGGHLQTAYSLSSLALTI